MSKYTKEDIIKSAQENNVEFIRLQFTDMFGIMKNVAITLSQLEKALDNAVCLTVLPSTALFALMSPICICTRLRHLDHLPLEKAPECADRSTDLLRI